MSCVEKLRSALAAVPVDQACTGAAVGALFTAGHVAARDITNDVGKTPQEMRLLREACTQQQLPGACMPVLAWLASGLRSGLPATATQQAHEMACWLLKVVTRALPDIIERSEAPYPESACTLQQLGDPGASRPSLTSQHSSPSLRGHQRPRSVHVHVCVPSSKHCLQSPGGTTCQLQTFLLKLMLFNLIGGVYAST